MQSDSSLMITDSQSGGPVYSGFGLRSSLRINPFGAIYPVSLNRQGPEGRLLIVRVPGFESGVGLLSAVRRRRSTPEVPGYARRTGCGWPVWADAFPLTFSVTQRDAGRHHRVTCLPTPGTNGPGADN